MNLDLLFSECAIFPISTIMYAINIREMSQLGEIFIKGLHFDFGQLSITCILIDKLIQDFT